MNILTFTGLGLPPAASFVVLAITYAVASRAAGGGWPKLDAKLPGRLLAWAAVLAALVGFLVGGVPLLVMGLAWGLYRSLPFGKNWATPTRAIEYAGAFVRHATIAAVGFFQGAAFDRPWLGPMMLVYAVGATVMAVRYGQVNAQAAAARQPIDPMQNVIVEVVQGLLFGVALWGGAVLLRTAG